MLFLLSPAKSLDFSPGPEGARTTRPRFAADTAELAAVARELSRADLRRLMGISEDLAELNHQRFQAFGRRRGAGLQAAFAFAGDVYGGLDARSLDPEALDWAQDRIRILSGLYGLLRPLDRIEAYRLEMGTRLRTPRGVGLYAFWGDRIARALNADTRGHPDRTIINLASQEYFSAVDLAALKQPVISPRFVDEKDGEGRVLGLFAKRARGLMARWAIDNRIERCEDLKAFDVAGYRFDPAASSEDDWVFSRPQPPAPAARPAPAKARRSTQQLESA